MHGMTASPYGPPYSPEIVPSRMYPGTGDCLHFRKQCTPDKVDILAVQQAEQVVFGCYCDCDATNSAVGRGHCPFLAVLLHTCTCVHSTYTTADASDLQVFSFEYVAVPSFVGGSRHVLISC